MTRSTQLIATGKQNSAAMTLYRPTFSIVSSVILLISIAATTAQSQTADQSAKVDSIMAAWSGTDRPGVALAYVEDGEIVHKGAWGIADLQQSVAWKTTTVSDLGSVSKQFIGFAMALLAEEGALSLDDDVRTHLPHLPDFGATITIDDLIYHRSGLREVYETLAMINWRGGDGLYQEHAQTLVEHQARLQFEPGSAYLYNNTEYMLMADIIEVVTGMEFHDWMDARIFAPLGMDDTTIMVRPGQVIPGAAASYGRDGDGYWNQIYDNSTVQGAGGIYSSVEDLARWMDNFAKHTVGTPATVDVLTTNGSLNDGSPIDYARGIIVNDIRGQRVWSHNGASAGFRSQLIYLPDSRRGLVVLAATSSIRIPIDELLDAFMGDLLEPEGAIPDVEAVEEDAQMELPVLSDPDAFTGLWLSDELQVFYDIRLEDDGLVLAHRWLSTYPMTWVGNDTFSLGGGRELRFERDASGQPSGFVWDNGRTIGVEFRRYE